MVCELPDDLTNCVCIILANCSTLGVLLLPLLVFDLLSGHVFPFNFYISRIQSQYMLIVCGLPNLRFHIC